jgi:hypothetical protein
MCLPGPPPARWPPGRCRSRGGGRSATGPPLLPAGHRDGADQILLDAGAGGAGRRDVEDLFDQIRQATARPDPDGTRRSLPDRADER